jgi:hypothetical protein
MGQTSFIILIYVVIGGPWEEIELTVLQGSAMDNN